jgi:hypothetical protein
MEGTEGADDTEFEAARQVHDAELTESLRSRCRGPKRDEIDESVFVFERPASGQPAASHEAFARDIAKGIVARAEVCQPLPRVDVLGLIGTAIEWMHRSDHAAADDIPVQDFRATWAGQRVTEI